jgi:hypothetical protein
LEDSFLLNPITGTPDPVSVFPTVTNAVDGNLYSDELLDLPQADNTTDEQRSATP